MDCQINLTRARKRGGRLLSKRIELDEQGRLKSDGSPCAMSRGRAKRVRLNGTPAADLATVIMELGSHEAIILGDIPEGLGDSIRIEKDDAADPSQGTFGRTKQNFVFRANEPAAALLDHDQKGMPEPIRTKLTEAGGFEGAIAPLIPGYEQLARVIRASTSAGIYHQETGERFAGSGGLHVYVLVTDGSDIPRFLDTLQKRAWLAGYGWIWVAARGQMLVRSIVDVSVGSPERLVFEGPPCVCEPLAQDHAVRQPIAHEGELLDSRAACPPLTADEQRRFDAMLAAAKLAAKPETEAAVETSAKEIAQARGIDIAEARSVVRSSLSGTLTSHDLLEFDDDSIGIVSVADVLADPERFHGQTLADPLEGRGYGRGKAKLYRNANGGVTINSQAHGGGVYSLHHDAAFIEARVTEAGEGAPFVLASLMPHTRGMDPVTRERLRNLGAKLGGVSRRSVTEVIREEAGKASKAAIDAAGERFRKDHANAGGSEGEPAPNASDPKPEGKPGADWADVLETLVAELNKVYFVAAVSGSVRIAKTLRDEALGRDRLVFLSEADMRLRYSYRHLKVGETQKGYDIVKSLGDAWINHRNRRTYDRIALIPDGPCPADVYNLWRGFGVQPQSGSWSTLDEHLRSVICSGQEDYYNWLIGWLAYCVQHPGKQAEVAVVLRGLKGTGKGMVGQMLMRIFRDHALQITHSKHLVGHFNAHLLDSLFLFLDEAFWAGDKQGEGTLKALITEGTVMIEPKGVDSFQMPNRLKILMASNSDWVVPASAEERRYFVLDVSDCRKGDKAYFNQLAAAVEGDELAAFLDYLLSLDLAGFDHRNPPHTEGLNKQKLIGAESFLRYWHDCLESGFLLNTGEGDWPDDVVCQVLHAGYVEHAHQHGDRHPLTINQLGVRLRQISPKEFGITRPNKPWNGVQKPSRYKLRELEEHQTAFLAAMKIDATNHQWPKEE